MCWTGGFWCGTEGCVKLRGFRCWTEGFLAWNWGVFNWGILGTENEWLFCVRLMCVELLICNYKCCLDASCWKKSKFQFWSFIRLWFSRFKLLSKNGKITWQWQEHKNVCCIFSCIFLRGRNRTNCVQIITLCENRHDLNEAIFSTSDRAKILRFFVEKAARLKKIKISMKMFYLMTLLR